MSKSLLVGLLFAVISLAPAQDRERRGSQRSDERLIKEVRHELVMLPYYSVFDDLSYKVEGGTVTLYGAVTRPTLKSDAENVVKKIEGVERVVNNIEVLPVSPNDDSIRRAVYRAIYSQPGLDTYSLRAVPTIHIIVKNGNVTLEGTVNSDSDKNLAALRAGGIAKVLSMKNNLVVQPKGSAAQ